MFNVSAIQRLRLKHNLTRSNDETEVSSLLQARGMDTGRLWRETMHTRRGMIKEASLHAYRVYRHETQDGTRSCAVPHMDLSLPILAYSKNLPEVSPIRKDVSNVPKFRTFQTSFQSLGRFATM